MNAHKNIEDIETQIAAIRAHEAAELAKAAAAAERALSADRKREEVERELSSQIEAQRASLAHDLETSVDAAFAALEARRSAATGETRRIYEPLRRLWNTLDRNPKSPTAPKPIVASEARHALAAIGQLPPIRKSDKAFATERELRTLPAPVLEVGSVVTDAIANNRFGALCAAMRITMPRLKSPAVESPQAARDRLGPQQLTYGHADFIRGDVARYIDRQTAKLMQDQRARELALIEERWAVAHEGCRAEYHSALVAQRIEIVATLDRMLAELPLGEGWFWCRALRRIAAIEPQVKIAAESEMFDVGAEHIFHLACANGARFTSGK